jgi:hypothetical protein
MSIPVAPGMAGMHVELKPHPLLMRNPVLCRHVWHKWRHTANKTARRDCDRCPTWEECNTHVCELVRFHLFVANFDGSFPDNCSVCYAHVPAPVAYTSELLQKPV